MSAFYRRSLTAHTSTAVVMRTTMPQGWRPTKATLKSLEGGSRVQEIHKRRKKINRTGWVNKKKTKRQTREFNAFRVRETIDTEEGRRVTTSRTVAPETGIHSLEWAANIAPQSSGFLRLPIEIRKQIYGLLFADSVIKNPRRKAGKYMTLDETCSSIAQYNTLAEVCRQTYVDIVGGSALYAFGRFSFSSPATMIRYLDCINPAHKETIQDITLSISAHTASSVVPRGTLQALSALTSLQKLTIEFYFARDLCLSHWPTVQTLNGVIWWSTSDRIYSVNDHTLYYLNNAQWTQLRGLQSFEIKFAGLSSVSRTSSHQYLNWSDQFSKDHATHSAIIENIKAIVSEEESGMKS